MAARGAVHWRRPLRCGLGCEFYFRSPDGQTMKGTAVSNGTATFLQQTFEQHTGCTLPDPETKPMRGGRRVRPEAR